MLGNSRRKWKREVSRESPSRPSRSQAWLNNQ
jgi:hypothetical protein